MLAAGRLTALDSLHAAVKDWDDMFASAEPKLGRQQRVVLESLQAACETTTPVSIMAAHMTLSSAGHLRHATEAGVVILVPHPPRDSLARTLLAISFPVGGKAAGFTSHVDEERQLPDGSAELVLQIPERIQMGPQRASVRVPVPRGTLRAAILQGEDLQPVVAIDLSLQGILVEFSRGQVPDIEEGHRRMVALKLDGKSVLLEAEVRRRDGPRYGMLFIDRGERSPKLVKMVTTLQYLWSPR